MKGRNCPNCGAPYEIGINRCPYCGTAYFDMSTIDFDTKEPFYLSFRYNGVLYTQRVYPESCDITAESDDVVCGKGDGSVISFHRTMNVNTRIGFQNIPENGVYITTRELE